MIRDDQLSRPKCGKLFLAVISVLCVIQSAMAQNQRVVDSLLASIKSSSQKQQVNALIELSLEFSDDHYMESLEYADRAMKLALVIGDSAQMVRVGRIKGQLLRVLDRIDESIIVLKIVYPVARRNKFMKDYKRILNALAIGYTYKANFDEALKYHVESLAIREAEGNKAEISTSLNNIGLVYFKMEEYDHALRYYNKALTMKREVNETEIEFLLINIGLCHIYLRNYDEGLRFIDEAFRVCDGSCTKLIKMQGKFGIGLAKFKSGKFIDAEGYFTESLAFAVDIQDKRYQIENLLLLAEGSVKLVNTDKALSLLRKAEVLSGGTGYNQLIMEIYRDFFAVYNQMGAFRDAAAYEVRHIQMEDSIKAGQLSRVAKIQSDFEERENLQTIASQKQILTFKEKAILNHQIVIFLVGAIAVLFVGLSIVLFKVNRQKQRINFLLDMKVGERTRSLEETLATLQRNNDEQGQFLIKTSSDLRGPLLTMKGLFQVMLNDLESPQTMREDLEKLEVTAANLSVMVDRLKEKRKQGI